MPFDKQFKFDPAELAKVPALDIRGEVTREIAARLAKGEAVKLTCGDQVLATFHPDGRVETDGHVYWLPPGTTP